MSLHEQFEQMHAEYFEGVSHGRREYLEWRYLVQQGTPAPRG